MSSLNVIFQTNNDELVKAAEEYDKARDNLILVLRKAGLNLVETGTEVKLGEVIMQTREHNEKPPTGIDG